jgi:hypothetical protein
MPLCINSLFRETKMAYSLRFRNQYTIVRFVFFIILILIYYYFSIADTMLNFGS